MDNECISTSLPCMVMLMYEKTSSGQIGPRQKTPVGKASSLFNCCWKKRSQKQCPCMRKTSPENLLVFSHCMKGFPGKNVPEEMSSLFSSCIKTLKITGRRAMRPRGEKAWLPEESIQALSCNIARIKMSPKF